MIIILYFIPVIDSSVPMFKLECNKGKPKLSLFLLIRGLSFLSPNQLYKWHIKK